VDAKRKDLKCGLIMPISEIDGLQESHWQSVRDILTEAMEDTGFVVEMVSDSNEAGIIQKNIVQNLYDNEIVICDVSAKNPNVMFELGMRLAFDKPTVVIKDDVTNYSFDTSPIQHLSYRRDLRYHETQSFKAKLREKVLATHDAARNGSNSTFLKSFGEFVVARLEEKEVSANQFMLNAIAELRNEVRQLARQSSVNRESPASRLISLVEVPLKDEYDFVMAKLKEKSDPIQYLDLLSGDASAFMDLVSEHSLTQPPGSDAERKARRSRLRKVVESLRGNWITSSASSPTYYG